MRRALNSPWSPVAAAARKHVYRRQASTLPSLLEQRAQDKPDAPALICSEENLRWTYAELAQKVAAVAGGMRVAGFVPGDTVMMCLPNRSENVLLQLAAAAAGLQVATVKDATGIEKLSGLESKEDRKRRAALGLGEENVLASQLACHNINGTAMFMLVGRQPVPGSPQLHELGFFDRELWATFLEYMQRARANAPFFGGTAAAWALKIQCVIARLNSCDQDPLAPDATQADAR